MPSREERLGFGESEAAAAEAPAGGGGLGEGLRKGRRRADGRTADCAEKEV
jgi:hypothetical protein